MIPKLSFVLTLAGLLGPIPPAFGQDPVEVLDPPVYTYSIVARDPETGQMGVAVQSHYYSVGSVVPWAEAGVGAVATQAFAEKSYGPLGLALMRGGKSAEEALRALVALDERAAIRQVAMIDAKGGVAAHTGERCVPAAAHRLGKNYSVQGNFLLNEQVVPAMAEAFEKATGSLADRMVAALEAAQAAGGDLRGQQSAAILIVRGESTGKSWEDKLMDLRVEDHPQPVEELKRLVRLHQAYGHYLNARISGHLEEALKNHQAAERLAPEKVELFFWHGVTLANAGRVEEALPFFKKAFEEDIHWALLVPRLPRSGRLVDDPAVIEKILTVSPQKIETHR